jgi:cell wall-associated NlpC family hydrolase
VDEASPLTLYKFHPRCSRNARPDVGKPLRKAARVLLKCASMRSLPARLLMLLSLVIALVAVMAVGGCAADTGDGRGEGAGGSSATGPGAGDVDEGEGEDGSGAGGAVGDIGDDGEGDGPLTAVDDGAPNIGTVTTSLTANSKMKTTANVNLRKGAGTSYAILAVIPSGSIVTLLSATPSNGFLNISFNGTSGWSSATYLTEVTTTGSTGGTSGGTVDLDGAPSPDNAIARAKKAVGFSYYWGGGAWLAAGVSSSTRGSCSGSCPSCSHSGKYGADCSGLVAKAWQFGTKALEVNSHPYSTASFVQDVAGKWSTVSRSSLRKGDALVYRSGGGGHIVVYEKGDGWGTPTVIECRGCSYGCVYNARSFTSNYHGIRRAGF